MRCHSNVSGNSNRTHCCLEWSGTSLLIPLHVVFLSWCADETNTSYLCEKTTAYIFNDRFPFISEKKTYVLSSAVAILPNYLLERDETTFAVCVLVFEHLSTDAAGNTQQGAAAELFKCHPAVGGGEHEA